MKYAQQHEQGEKLFSVLISEDAIEELASLSKKQISVKNFFKKLE